MSPLSSLHVAVVGGGAAGYTAVILLAAAGAATTLLEAQPTLNGAGSGIMLQANALRVLGEAGVLSAVEARGFGFDSTGIRMPDATARLVGELIDGRFEPDLPAAVGIARSQLARILHDRAVEVGATVRLGTEVAAVHQHGSGDHSASGATTVDVAVRAGQSAPSVQRDTFDLLVAADGVNSTVRSMLGITTVPRLLPLGVWRVTVPRPAAVVRTEIINGGPAYFAGYAPTSQNAMYAWLVDDYTDRRNATPTEQIDVVRALMAGYHGPWDDIRASLTAHTPISYTRYSELLLPVPWHRGRVVLIGDAVHACPPTMAQGAAQALEDASVLTEMLTSADRVDDDLLSAYATRRLPRVRAVVEGSVQMAEWQLRHESGDVSALMGRTTRLLAQPA